MVGCRAAVWAMLSWHVVAEASRHILFLMVDEMDGRVLADSSAQFKPPMPNIRQLMSRGTTFPTAYTSAPQCVPARTSMMTGRHTSDIKVWDNFVGIVSVDGNQSMTDHHCKGTYGLDECLAFASNQSVDGTFVDVLVHAGYNVTLWGKMHAGAGLDQYQGQLEDFPFDAVDAKAAGEFARATGVLPRSFKKFKSSGKDHEEKPARSMDYTTTDECSALLRGGLFQSSTPQFLYCSVLVPHPPYATNSTYMSRVPSLLNWSIPRWTPKSELHPSDAYTQMAKRECWEIDDAEPEQVDHLRRVYFSMCTEADDLMGRILDALQAGGSREEPYIIFLSDHGEHALEHRQLGKNSMLEASARVPLVIAGPGIPRGAASAQLASLHDVYPTVLDMAGSEARPGPLAGETLLPVAKGEARQRSHVIAQYHSVYSGTGMFMVRKDDWKLIVYAAQQPGQDPWEPQLFHMAEDPWERANLAGKHPDVVEQLREVLAAEVDMEAADAEKKAFDKYMFEKYWYEKHGGAESCASFMEEAFPGFDPELDAPRIEAWLGRPCPPTVTFVV